MFVGFFGSNLPEKITLFRQKWVSFSRTSDADWLILWTVLFMSPTWSSQKSWILLYVCARDSNFRSNCNCISSHTYIWEQQLHMYSENDGCNKIHVDCIWSFKTKRKMKVVCMTGSREDNCICKEKKSSPDMTNQEKFCGHHNLGCHFPFYSQKRLAAWCL